MSEHANEGVRPGAKSKKGNGQDDGTEALSNHGVGVHIA